MQLFDKYQYLKKEVSKRGYSKHCFVRDGRGNTYWAKWIIGIQESSAIASQISDELRRFQRAQHECLPKLIDYGYDEQNQGYAIISEFIESSTSLSDRVSLTQPNSFFDGLLSIIDCLSQLNREHYLTHGDITPENIIVDYKGQFYLVDFGLADLANNLSQEKSIQVFAANFAAPEKFQPHKSGFAYQSDVYSLGRLVHWFMEARGIPLEEAQTDFFDGVLAENPAERPTYPEFRNMVQDTFGDFLTKSVEVAFRDSYYRQEILGLLKDFQPRFHVSGAKGSDMIVVDILLGQHLCRRAHWHVGEQRMYLQDVQEVQEKDRAWIKHFKAIEGEIIFSEYPRHQNYDSTPLFRKWLEEKKEITKAKFRLRSVEHELGFYNELLKKELDVIRKGALTLQYEKLRERNGDLHITISRSSIENNIGLINKQIESSSHFDADPVEFNLSSDSERKRRTREQQNGFTGKPIKFDVGLRELVVADCEGINLDKTPVKGWLLEDTSTIEEEKNRQLEAIEKVKRQNVLNPNLLYYLFNPKDLEFNPVNTSTDLDVQQKDENCNPFEYSFNQKKAVLTALEADPFCVIQGPPGTGKTTVITEIVFQLLKKNPGVKILITSQTNSAVDQVLENLLKNEIPVCRLSGVSKPLEILRPHTLDRKLEGWKSQVRKRVKANHNLSVGEPKTAHPLAPTISGILDSSTNWGKTKDQLENCFYRFPDLKRLHKLPHSRTETVKLIDEILGTKMGEADQWKQLRDEWLVAVGSLEEKSSVYNKLIDSIRVFGATCNHIGAKRYKRYNFDFDYVIMDESGKATVAESLVPITLGKKLVYVGDHRQLKPMLTSSKEVSDWLKKKSIEDGTDFDIEDDHLNRPSLFEMVIKKTEDYKTQLTDCRRSSIEQVRLTSKCFYERFGDEKINPVQRPLHREHCLPLSIESSVFFIDIGNQYKSQKDAKQSSFNEKSIEVIVRLLRQLNKFEKVKEYDFGVLAGYTAQMNRLKSKIGTIKNKISNVSRSSGRDNKLTVSVFDRFQGLERDVMIVDLVRSGPKTSLGFMEVPNRINVALSRQKRLLIMVGDYDGLVKAKPNRVKGKAALQDYLLSLDSSWIINEQKLEALFSTNE